MGRIKSISSSHWKKLVIAVIVVLIAYFYNAIKTNFDSPIVNTCSGKVQGFSAWSRTNKEFYSYLGIPFAKPPVGALRFEPPELPEKWEGILYAGKYGRPCVQVSFMTSIFLGGEDCLYLNVHAPKKAKPEKPLPVIIWFYGGMFMEGMANIYNPAYLMDEDVVVVTLNYRVGALGFLNTNDHVVRGNMGLKDQNFAMRWVQRNIKNFGGDPGQVTIAGQSAGGASVHYHMLSKLSKGLFHKAISASGVAVSPWAFNKYPQEQAVRFARRFCPTENTTEMVACLKLLPATTIQDAHVEVVDLLRDPLSVFVPTVEAVKDENAFITVDPLEIAKNESVNKVPWLAGVTSDEGLMFTAMTLTNQTLLNAAIHDWMYLVPRTMYLREDMDMKTIVAIKEQYFGNATTISADSIEQYQNFTNVFSDRHFFSGLQASAPLHAKHSPVYLYYFSHLPKYSIATLLLSRGEVLHPIVDFGIHIVKRWIKEKVFGIKTPSNGTSHIDDLGYIFNLGIPGHIQDEIENEMSRRIVKLYTSFASSNGESDVINFGDATWPPLNSLHSLSPNDTRPLKYMDIGLNPKIIDEPFTVRVNFWNSLDLS